MSTKRSVDHFTVWLSAQKREHVCTQLEVNPNTIKNWVTGKSFPTVRHMKRIKRISRGRVTYAMIIDRKPHIPKSKTFLSKKTVPPAKKKNV